MYSVLPVVYRPRCVQQHWSQPPLPQTPTTLSLLQQPSPDAAVTKAQQRNGACPAQPSCVGLDGPERPNRRRHAHAQEIEYGPAHLIISARTSRGVDESALWQHPNHHLRNRSVGHHGANRQSGRWHPLSNGLCHRRFRPNNFTNMLRIPVSLTVTSETAAPPPRRRQRPSRRPLWWLHLHRHRPPRPWCRHQALQPTRWHWSLTAAKGKQPSARWRCAKVAPTNTAITSARTNHGYG